MILSVALSAILIGLGSIHFNWAFGGEFGSANAVPTKDTGERVLNPGKGSSAIVGSALTAFGLFYIFRTGLVDINLPVGITDLVGWIVPGIFLLRAIGDFNYVGFFKRIKQTGFGRMDTLFYSPLCLLIGVAGSIVQLSE